MEVDLPTPRWLLDIDKWERVDYENAEPQNGQVEYGIVSYTWGRWRDPRRVAEGKPDNIRWQIPYVEALPLSKAKRVMKTMGMRYVWWDWMCVPQNSSMTPLSRKEIAIAGDEIAKQMNIYIGATASIVWLHNVEWARYPLLTSFLAGNMRLQPQDEANFRDVALVTEFILRHIQTEEPWLTSGWTLQEGVLLPNTPLLDSEGFKLLGDIFEGGRATVASISKNINPLASRVAAAFMLESQGDPVANEELIVRFIRSNNENYEFIAGFLAKLIRSGLVGYGKHAPLFLLAGKASRTFSTDEDHCWALIGAMEIDVPNPQYNNGQQMDQVISRFFEPLLAKYQWALFLIGRMMDNEWGNKSWPRRVVEGHALPLEIYFGVIWLEKLPLLRLDPKNPNRLLLTPNGSERIWLISRHQHIYCRRYKQTTFQNGIVRVSRIEREKTDKSLFLRVASLESLELKGVEGAIAKGFRCIEIEHNINGQGLFLGVADVWSVNPGNRDDFHYTQKEEYTLL